MPRHRAGLFFYDKAACLIQCLIHQREVSQMKILAIEKETPGGDADEFKAFGKAEAAKIWQLIKDGFVREIHFDQHHNAVILLECNDLPHASEILNELPFVKNNLISFQLYQLDPYTGFDRLFCQ